MTFFTNRHNIEIMFWVVAAPMVIFLCWLCARMAESSIRTSHFTGFNSVIYSTSGLSLFRMFCSKPLNRKPIYEFTIFSLFVSFIFFFDGNLAFFALAVFPVSFSVVEFTCFRLTIFPVCFSMAYFTILLVTVFAGFVLVKLRMWLDLLASATSFCYDLLSHNQLLNSWLRLEPIAAHTAVGSSYYTQGGT